MSRSRRPRVLFFAPMPPPHGGVAEISRGVYEGLPRTDFDVTLLDFSKGGGERIRTFVFEWADLWWGVVFWWRLVIALVKVRPDVLYIASSFDQSYLRNAILMMTAKFSSAAVVCHFHGYRSGGVFGDPGPLLRWILRLTSKTYDRMIYLSDLLRVPVEEILGTGKGVSVPNFVEPGEFRVSSGLRADPVHILFIGRVTERKGIFVLLEAAGRLRKSEYRFVLDVIGVAETEDEERRVQTAVDAAGIRDVTVFHGVKVGSEKAHLLARGAMLVLPSWADIFPVVVLEAFASGLPVVAASVAALPEMVQDGTSGFLCKPQDTDSLTSALRRLLDDPSLREAMGRHNRQLAETRYSRDAVAAHIGTILREVVPDDKDKG